MTKAYTYCRASSNDSEDVANSVPAQAKRTRAYFDMKLADQGIEFAGNFADKSVSASKYSFDERPAAKRLLEVIEDGDHIIFDKLDRIWRSVYDFERLHRYFLDRNITWHIVNESGVAIDTSAAFGKAMVTIMVAFAELEAKQAGERQRASVKMRRAQGRLVGHPPRGMRAEIRVVDGQEMKFLAWDRKMRSAMGQLLKIWDNCVTMEEGINDACEVIARSQGRNWKRSYVKKLLGRRGFRDIAGLELCYRKLEAEGLTAAGEVAAAMAERGWAPNKDKYPDEIRKRLERRQENKRYRKSKEKLSDEARFEKLLAEVRAGKR